VATNQLRRAVPPAAILVLLFLFVLACVPTPITDLRPVSVGRSPASALPSADNFRDTLMQRGESVLKVSFSGSADWIREIRQHQLSSYPVVVRCDDRDSAIFALGPYVGQVPVTYQGDGLDDYQPKSATVQYDVYLPETGRYRSEADFNAPMSSYDLGRQRLALCIRIAGGAMYGAYARSNEVRVEVGRTK
jgi:hypothetical protein